MTFTFDELKLARERGYSDDEIWNTLSAEDEEIGLAKQRGYSLEEVASITSGQPMPEEEPKEFFSFEDAVSAIGTIPEALAVGIPAAYQKLVTGLEIPEESEAIESELAFQERIQKEQEDRIASGKATSVGSAIREALPSISGSVASMGAAIPAGIAGGVAGGPAGFATGPAAAMAASGTVAYRMAGSDMLYRAFKQLEQNKGEPLTDEEKAEAYKTLLPIAQNNALWEAGPEAVSNAVSLGAGKFVFGFGKQAAKNIVTDSITAANKTLSRKIAEKTAAAAGGVATEVGSEAVTAVGQYPSQAQMQKFVETGTTEGAPTEYPGGYKQAVKDVAPATLATIGILGTAAGGVKLATLPFQSQKTPEQIEEDNINLEADKLSQDLSVSPDDEATKAVASGLEKARSNLAAKKEVYAALEPNDPAAQSLGLEIREMERDIAVLDTELKKRIGTPAKEEPVTTPAPEKAVTPTPAAEEAVTPAVEPPAEVEKIKETAIIDKDGNILSSPRKTHAQLMEESQFDLDAGEFPPTKNFGFVTTTGRFVLQDEAQKIASAAKQVQKNQPISGEIVSEINKEQEVEVQPTPTPQPRPEPKTLEVAPNVIARFGENEVFLETDEKDWVDRQKVGSFEINQMENGLFFIENSMLEEGYRGKGIGPKVVKELAKQYGEIASDEYSNTSASARSMWKNAGAKLEDVVEGEDVQKRFVLRAITPAPVTEQAAPSRTGITEPIVATKEPIVTERETAPSEAPAPEVGDIIAVDRKNNTEFALVKGLLPERPDMFSIGIRLIGSNQPFESGGYGHNTNKDSVMKRFFEKERRSLQDIEIKNQYFQNILNEEEGRVSAVEAKESEKKQQEQERQRQFNEEKVAYEDAISQVKIPTGKSETMRFTAPDGSDQAFESKRYGDVGIRKVTSGKNALYNVDHWHSGLRIMQFNSLSEAKKFTQAIIASGADISKKDIQESELEKLRPIARYFRSGEVVPSIPSQPAAPTPAVSETITEPAEAAAPAQPAGIAVGNRIKLGKSPQTYTIEEVIPQSSNDKKFGEQYYSVKNEKTGETQVVEKNDMKPVGARKRRMAARPNPLPEGERYGQVKLNRRVQSYFGGKIPDRVYVVDDAVDPEYEYKAAYYPDEGILILNNAFIRKNENIGDIIAHELGHYAFGDAKFKAAFDEFYNSLTPEERAEVDKIVEDGYSYDTEESQMEERRVIAFTSFTIATPQRRSLWNAVLDAMKSFLNRVFGKNFKMSDPTRTALAMLATAKRRFVAGEEIVREGEVEGPRMMAVEPREEGPAPESPEGKSIPKAMGDGIDIGPENNMPINRKIDSHIKNFLFLRGFFESASDRLRRNKFEKLADAIDSYYDNANRRLGVANKILGNALNAYAKSRDKKQIEEDFGKYMAAQENNRDTTAIRKEMHPIARKLVDAWQEFGEESGKDNQLVDVKVFEKTKEGGFWRKIGRVKKFWPRRLKPEYQKALFDEKKYPKEYNEIVEALMDAGTIKTPEEAEKYLRDYNPQGYKNDYFSGIEKARGNPLPEKLYDYSLPVMTDYVSRWAQHVSRIEAFGQKTTEQSMTLWDRELDSVRDQRTKDYIVAARERVEGYFPNDPFLKGTAALNIWATGLQLGNPASAALNLIGGTTLNAMIGQPGALGSYAESLIELRKLGANIQDAKEKGILSRDLMNIVGDHQSVLESNGVAIAGQKVADFLLKWSGFTPVEQMIRTQSFIIGKSFIRQSIQANTKSPNSSFAKRSRAWLTRNRFDLDKLIVEQGDGPETDKLLRYFANISQGSYTVTQVPIFIDTPIGKFLFKYQKFSTQVMRSTWMNTFKPALDAVLNKNQEVQLPNQTRQLLYKLRLAEAKEMGDTRPVKLDDIPKKVGKAQARALTIIPAMMWLASAYVGGEVLLRLRDMLFGVLMKGPDYEDIIKAFENDDESKWAYLGLERAWYNLIGIGALGLLGNYAQFFLDWSDRERVKNPLDPPSLGVIKETANFIGTAYDQRTITAGDIDDFATRQVSAYRTTKKLAQSTAGWFGAEDLPTVKQEMFRREVANINKYARRWADEAGIEYRMRRPGDVAATERTPINRKISSYLQAGDVEMAGIYAKQYLDSLPKKERKNAIQSITSSARSRQPLRLGSGPMDEDERKAFLRWLKDNVSEERYKEIAELDKEYQKNYKKFLRKVPNR